ncbi:MAG: hypothetical protein KatS3mg050_1713 [Litorilinea sp.]|nr:MAG: hypothetical protein KatS3mg050_1713 [Litorilinea sp.]
MTTFVWSIDDAGAGDHAMVESLRRMCAFFDSRGLPSTWFVVPKARGKPLSAEWQEALAMARDAGHDLQLHGLTHEDCYEFGPPAWPATSIVPTMQEEFDRRRDELLPRYTVENLRARLEEGLAIFERALAIRPTVFRAPCGAISKAMFAALAQVGIRYHTVMYLSGGGYQHLPHNSGVLAQPWTTAIPHRPFRWYSDVVEVPILNEYTWRGAGQRSQEFIDLARQEVARIAAVSPVAVILMHTHGIADDYDHAFRLVDAVAEQVLRQGDRFATLGELAASGELDAAALDTGPDILSF